MFNIPNSSSVLAGLEIPASDRQYWFIPNDAVTDWSTYPIASGGFGQVFTASYYGAPVAAKRLHVHFDDDALVYFAREIGIWHGLSHPHILPLLGACDKDHNGRSIRPFMVSPFMPNGTLLKFVSDTSNPRSVEEKLRLLYQVAAGMSYLHGKNIVHGDLKAANVLLDESYRAIVTDFGLSRTKHTSASAARVHSTDISGGTHGYMAPEMLDEEPAGSSKKSDVFAFAITMYEVLNNGRVWITKQNSPMKHIQIISQVLQNRRPKRFDGIPDGIWALIERCWAQDPAARPTFPDILAVLQPYSRPAAPAIPTPATVKSPSVNRVARNSSPLSVNDQPSPQYNRTAKFEFEGIDSSDIPVKLVTRAKQGDTDACLEAAKLVLEGPPTCHEDWKLVAQLYMAAADRGNLEASFHMAWLMFLGKGMTKNDHSTFTLWQDVSNKSTDPVLKPIATHMLGWMYYLGRGTMQDEQRGIKIIRDNKSDVFKLGEAECMAANWNDIKSDSPSARKFFELCQLGSDHNWLCRHLMAVCLVHGFGTTENQAKAAAIFEQLANDGHSDCQVWIGESYLYGRGISEVSSKAIQWFRKSADQGNSYGQWKVGFCNFHGYGSTKDVTKAAEWYRISAEQGNSFAQNDLGACYYFGWGVSKNVDTAVFWYRKSASQDQKWAIDKLERLGKWP